MLAIFKPGMMYFCLFSEEMSGDATRIRVVSSGTPACSSIYTLKIEISCIVQKQTRNYRYNLIKADMEAYDKPALLLVMLISIEISCEKRRGRDFPMKSDCVAKQESVSFAVFTALKV